MEEYITVTAKTVKDAILEASLKLETFRDNIEYEVIEEGSTGFLGFGSKKAIIKARKKVAVEDILKEEVKEETNVAASIIKYVGKSQYTFNTPNDTVVKDVHWYLMMADSYHSKPQREEFFVDSGYYKFHEIYHLLRFANEKQIVEKAYQEYLELRSAGLWDRQQKYF
jgi:hypothetical protein